ncbi:MAG: DNA translocase FtsK, partial [Clostridia bacterium]|nr:DNA translocase FtsK [Clostridia bacterium]
ILLIVKRKGKARLRVACIMILPVLLGALRHLSSDAGRAAYSLKTLAADGRALQGGGILAGSLAALLRAAISDVGAIILCAVFFLVALGIACNTTPAALWRRMRPSPESEEYDEDERQTPAPFNAAAHTPRHQAPRPLTGGKRALDISIGDDQPDLSKPIKKPASTRLAPPSVPTPAEVLAAQQAAEVSSVSAKPEESVSAEPQPETAAEEKSVRSGLFSFFSSPAPAQADPTRPVTPDFALSQTEITPPEQKPAEPAAEPADKPADEPTAEIIDIPAPEETPAPPAEQELPPAAAPQIVEQTDPPPYIYPPISLLRESPAGKGDHAEEVRRCAERLTDTLQSFGVETTIVGITRGPTVTRYELQPQRGVKFSRIAGLSDDIALALGAASVRISTIPDKLAVGIEVPNESQQMITLREILDSKEFKTSKSRLSFAVGKDIEGKCIVGDISRMPHMLIAGTTGSGKSVCINSILISLIYKSTPDEVRLIMVDPKMIELGVYNGIPPLLIPVVTDPKKAAGALNWAVTEMMRRYKLFSEIGAR